MFFRIRADQGDLVVAQIAGSPYRTEFGIDEIGAASGMRNLAHVDEGDQFVFLGVHHRDLVGLVGRRQEVALGAVPAAIVEEARGGDGGHFKVVQILIVDHQDLAGFLDVDDEFGMLVRGNDGGDARFRMVFLGVHRHAAGGHDFQRFQGVPFHDHVLRRPVRTGDGVFIFPAFVL